MCGEKNLNPIFLNFEKVNVGQYLHSCRLCPHVVVVVGLVYINDPWGYAVKPLMVRLQTERDSVVYAGRFASRTRLLTRRACASEPATA